ncbi:LPS export ABC transporter periplasmic protein LptC [Williamwhitmania taraxaci]|uniref:LPS export ABC transporter protein LptC n=1 Tax=Williamwhitmania taraxaci TaxID=1640674 RepID=A0A1G6L623_9BACT|nr:LPS export ABC transporter periplasmic protein LptC [Williamwhitmania taraxaci]SDC38588.1 LPS export ABC transporter protein LptC [Williamwhitmania taraxaci]
MKNIIRLLKVAALLGAATFIFACSNDLEVIKSLATNENKATQIGKNITTIYTENGKVMVKMTAPELQRFENAEEPKTIFPKGIEITFYDQAHKPTSSLTCKYAIRYETKKLWEARNDVVGKNEKGDVLHTERLYWNEGEKKVYSNDFCKVIRGDGTVQQGKRFESDERFKNYSIFNFSGDINLNDE